MHCFHGHIVDLNNPKKDIVVGAGMLEIQSLNLAEMNTAVFTILY